MTPTTQTEAKTAGEAFWNAQWAPAKAPFYQAQHEKTIENCERYAQAVLQWQARAALGQRVRKRSEQEVREYILGLKVGERVQETSQSALFGRQGTVYRNPDNCVCVMWDKYEGEDGQMGTSCTEGARRVSEVVTGYLSPPTPTPEAVEWPSVEELKQIYIKAQEHGEATIMHSLKAVRNAMIHRHNEIIVFHHGPGEQDWRSRAERAEALLKIAKEHGKTLADECDKLFQQWLQAESQRDQHAETIARLEAELQSKREVLAIDIEVMAKKDGQIAALRADLERAQAKCSAHEEELEQAHELRRKLTEAQRPASPWIACSERMPTKEDASIHGEVMWAGNIDRGTCYACADYHEKPFVVATHWMSSPPLVESLKETALDLARKIWSPTKATPAQPAQAEKEEAFHCAPERCPMCGGDKDHRGDGLTPCPNLWHPANAQPDPLAEVKCSLCGIQMTKDENCGGDCVYCMADAGDPDCIHSCIAMAKSSRHCKTVSGASPISILPVDPLAEVKAAHGAEHIIAQIRKLIS